MARNGTAQPRVRTWLCPGSLASRGGSRGLPAEVSTVLASPEVSGGPPMSQYAWIEESLSLPRFLPYFKACAGDVDAALKLYWWNLEVSAGFYAPLHCLEIGLRNALHAELAQRFG